MIKGKIFNNIFSLVANWRWHLGPKTDIPPLLQFDELGGGKFERMKDKLNLKFASEHGYCLPKSRHPKLDLQVRRVSL